MVTAGGANDTRGANDILSQMVTSRGGMAGGGKNKRGSSNILSQMVTSRGGPAGGANNIRSYVVPVFGDVVFVFVVYVVDLCFCCVYNAQLCK